MSGTMPVTDSGRDPSGDTAGKKGLHETGPARAKKGHQDRAPNREKGQMATTAENHHLARTRYFRTEVPSLATGTVNCAAKAAVFVYL